jgi:asparagine synthase (glutamine-hydrolysing)
MCGIAGIVKFDPREQAEEGRLLAMRDSIAHRGPDGQGLLLDGPVGLAHRRLAIVDVGAGRQPMCNEDGTVWIVFNGEIYNHADLRPGLEARGHTYRTRCDTETILHLYEEEGEGVVDGLHGMFAFAIWDRPRQRLLLARDRLGIKPLYYAKTDRELLFGSEIKAVLAAGGIRPVFDEAVLPEFLANRFVATDETFFRGVRKLMPGHVLSWTPSTGFRSRRYWRPPIRLARPEPVEGRARSGQALSARHDPTIREEAPVVRRLLETAVRSHLMSDVPLGVFLSGGLDSSALAAMVAHAARTRIQTFAVGFAEREANELEYARLVATWIGAEHREVVVTPAEYFNALPQLVWHEDEPIAFSSSIPLYFVARLAQDHVKVVLTGEGADELFLGYNKYRATFWNARLGRPYWALVPGPARRGVRQLVGALPGGARRYAGRSFMALEPGIRDLFLENFAVFPQALQRSLLAHPDVLDCRDPYADAMRYFDSASGSLLDRMSHVDLQTYLVELLMKQDQMSMAASIESRVPFLDDHVVEHVAALPGGLKLHGWRTKAVLREAVKDLIPPTILTRRKMGFPVPIGRWLREEFRPIVDEFVLGPRAQARKLFDSTAIQRLVAEHRAGWTPHGDRLWLLVNLEIWQRIFCEGERPADVMRAVSPTSVRVHYANSLGQDGRPLAVEHRRPGAQPPDHLGALAPPSGQRRHDTRVG